MQFAYPELLWGLFLLVIPVLVHLLRLRRYRKTPFTNVTLLKRIRSESNRSSQLKRWLLLLSRLGLFAALVLAFCQPYKPSEASDLKQDIVVYLDNSLSMQARSNGTPLLQRATQDILQSFPEDLRFTLLTQGEVYKEVQIADLRQRLLDLDYHTGTPSDRQRQLQVETLFRPSDSADRQLWVFSDFQGWEAAAWEKWDRARVLAVPYLPENPQNIAIDTAYLLRDSPENVELRVLLTLEGQAQPGPVSLYDGEQLIAKSGGEPGGQGTMQARFTLPATSGLNGMLQVTDNGLAYDNTLYITRNEAPPVRVLSIGPEPAGYLGRIFTGEAFELRQSTLRELDYSNLERQHLILLNELEALPPPLVTGLKAFVREGGSLVVIPAAGAQTNTYNELLETLGTGYGPQQQEDVLITEIHFDHPLLQDVFEQRVDNFDYPASATSFPIQGNPLPVIGYQNGQPFLAGGDGLYVFAAPLSGSYSNFRQSPLIVPCLYAIGRQSLPQADLYYQIGQEARLELDLSLQEDQILQMQGDAYTFIPRQQSFARKTRLSFGEEPVTAGNYRIENQGETLSRVSFNYPRKERMGGKTAAGPAPSFEEFPGVGPLVAAYQNRTRNTPLWKWFVILALLFVLAEVILQKTMR